MAITLTDKADAHVNRNLEKRGKGCGLRLGVRTTGCSGLAYQLEYVDEPAAEDQVFESNGVKDYSRLYRPNSSLMDLYQVSRLPARPLLPHRSTAVSVAFA